MDLKWELQMIFKEITIFCQTENLRIIILLLHQIYRVGNYKKEVVITVWLFIYVLLLVPNSNGWGER